MRGAVAAYPGLPYEVTPDVSGRRDTATLWSDRVEWLANRGLAMATFACAPGHLRRWIAIVGRVQPGPMHAVVMTNTELLHDPAPPPGRMAAVERADRHAEADAMRGRLDRVVHRRPQAAIAAA